MELSGAGEGIQYVTASESGEQQIFIQGGDGDMGGQSLLQGAQIVDGKLVLPQQYQYVTENGETVMLVYETPDGQQVVSENGEQIVFLDESQAGNEEGESTDQSEPQTTYIQQVGEDGQTFLQQVITTGSQEPQQTFIQVAAEDGQGQESADSGGEGSTSVAIQQQNIQNIKPGQSLLLPGAVPNKQPQAQIHVSEGSAGSSTVVMVTSDPNEMAFMEGEDATAGQAVEGVHQFKAEGDFSQEGSIQMTVQDGTQAEGEYATADGIQIKLLTSNESQLMKILKADEDGDETTPQPIAVMHMPGEATGDQVLNEAAANIMMQAAEAEPEVEPFTVDETPDEEGRITMIDPETGDLVRVMPVEQEEVPVLINPEEFEKEDAEEQEEEERFDSSIKLTMNKSVVGPGRPAASSGLPKLISTNTVVVKEGDVRLPFTKSMLDEMEDDDDDDSDFDEENLTPKVVYERLLAQHRKTKECQVCGDMLESYPQLKDHLMEHAGYNPCECQICGKIFNTSSKRAKHERSHSAGVGEDGEMKSPDGAKGSPSKNGDNGKKFECDICGRQMGRMEHLKRHKLLHKPGPTWRCIICEYSFKREDLVKDHIKKQHADALEQESLQDLYETLDYEGEENHQHKSQWNPKAKSQRPGMTPRNNQIASSSDVSTPKVKSPKTATKTPKQPGTGKRGRPKGSGLKVKTPKYPKAVKKPESESDSDTPFTPLVDAGNVRKSGRTPKPKKMDVFATEAEMKKAERELFKKDEIRNLKIGLEVDAEELDEDNQMYHDIFESVIDQGDKTRAQQDDDEEEDEEEESLPLVAEDIPTTVSKDTRRTVDKTVAARFSAAFAEDPRGRKRKKMINNPNMEEVLILTVMGPKMTKATMWKPFLKSRSGAASPASASPARTPSSAAQRGRKLGTVTILPGPKGKKSSGYEDEEFVYFDEDDEFEGEDDSSSAEFDPMEDEPEEDEDYEEAEKPSTAKKAKRSPVTTATASTSKKKGRTRKSEADESPMAGIHLKRPMVVLADIMD